MSQVNFKDIDRAKKNGEVVNEENLLRNAKTFHAELAKFMDTKKRMCF